MLSWMKSRTASLVCPAVLGGGAQEDLLDFRDVGFVGHGAMGGGGGLSSPSRICQPARQRTGLYHPAILSSGQRHHAHRHRPRRHQDRNHPSATAARCSPGGGGDAPGRLSGDRWRRWPGWWRRSRSSWASAAVWAWACRALSRRTGLVKNANSTCLIGKPCGRPGKPARPAGAPRQRRQLFCAVRRWRTVPRRGRTWCSGSSSALVWAAASWWAVRCSKAPTPSPASGATTRCPCRRRRSAAAGLLLRPRGLCGNLPFRPRSGGGSSAHGGGGAVARRDRRRCGGRRGGLRGDLARYADRLARALAGVINLLDPT